MAVMLQLLFSGLIAISPNSANKEATVLVLNDINAKHMPHQAFLTVQSGTVDPGSDFIFGPDPTMPAESWERTFVGSGYQLTLENTAQVEPLVYSDCRTLEPRSGSGVSQNVCILKAKDLRSAALNPSDDVLTESEIGKTLDVGLRFYTKAGKLRPYEQVDAGVVNARRVSWVPPSQTTEKTQYVPELMEWLSPPLGGTFVTLVLTPFGGGAPRKIKITPDGNFPVQVMISNHPNSRDVCALKKEERYKVMHLDRLARFHAGVVSASRTPVLKDAL